MASAPITAANTARTTRTPLTRTSLSCDPNAEMAKFFTGGGVKSMAMLPTAATGELCGLAKPDTSWPTLTATKPVINPASRPWPARRLLEGALTASIRSPSRSGVPCHGRPRSAISCSEPSGDPHRHAWVARGAVRLGWLLQSGLRVPSGVRGPRLDRVLAGIGVPLPYPLPPGVDARHRRQLG